jgi:prepilin-type N-terminal cleavage/methylation domain-containing protein
VTRRRSGFTLIEILMVMIILGILSSIALLKYLDLRATAQTASLAFDVRALTVAAFNYYADHEAWPPEAGPGQVPTGLTPYLSGELAVSLDRSDYTLDFENVAVGDSPLVGVAVTTTNERLRAKFAGTFGRAPFFMNGDKLTYLIAGPGGVF